MHETQKLCFVTIGATANFDALIHAVIQPSFLAALERAGYTGLRLQYGKIGEAILESHFGRSNSAKRNVNGITIEGFDFRPGGLTNDMVDARGGKDGKGKEGVVISHAGTEAHTGICRTSLTRAQALGPYWKPFGRTFL